MLLKPEDAGGVCPLLFMMSGYLAAERGSDWIEPHDLIKAIYIVDLEHVASFWNNWEAFERFITQDKLAEGMHQTYVNRTVYLVRLELIGRETPGSFVGLGKSSKLFAEVVNAARTLATERAGPFTSPTSRDLLFCACSSDPDVGQALQSSGLDLAKLAAAVSADK